MLTIVISMYNANNATLEALDNLLFPSLINNISKDFKLILLDDCSPLKNQTNDIVNKYKNNLSNFHNFTYIQNETNLGFSNSYNYGVSLSDTDSVLISNSDVYFPKGSIKKLYDVISKNNIADISAPVTNGAASFQNTHLFRKIKSYHESEINRIEEFSYWLDEKMRGIYVTTDDLIGFCLCLKRNVYEDIGLFESFVDKGGAEDRDFLYRASKKYKIVLDASTFIMHGGTQGHTLSYKDSIPKLIDYLYVSQFKAAKRTGGIAKLPIRMLKMFIQIRFDIGTISSAIKSR